MAINKLTQLQSFQLMQFVKEHYAESKVDDAEFAVTATQALGFTVTDGNIKGARKSLGIESNYDRRANAGKTAAVEVVDRLAAIENKLDRLLVYFSEQARRDL